MSLTPPPMRTAARPIGLLLVVPALLALLGSYVVPGVRTLWNSFQRIDLIRDGGGEFAGFDNYSDVADAGFFGDLGYVLLLATLPVLAACVLAPVLAWLAHRGGTPARRIVRLGLVLPMVALTPAGLALAWSSARLDLTGEPLQAQVLVGRTLWLTLLGLLVGAGVTLFLAALRRSGTGRPVRAVIAVGLVAGLAVVAYTLQTWTLPFVLTQGGPQNATGTPLLTLYNLSFRYADFGAGAAAGTVLALLLGVLGLAAVAVLVLGRVRVDVVAPPTGARPAGMPVLIGAPALLAVVLAVAGYGLWPWLTGLTGDTPDVGNPVNTWAPRWSRPWSGSGWPRSPVSASARCDRSGGTVSCCSSSSRRGCSSAPGRSARCTSRRSATWACWTPPPR
jgi:ABC-type sugar transport system permease subunit